MKKQKSKKVKLPKDFGRMKGERRSQGHLNRIEDAILLLAEKIQYGEWIGVVNEIRTILGRQ
jgi:hypothetical protein